MNIRKEHDPKMTELLQLAEAACAGQLSSDQSQRLDDLLLDCDERQQAWLQYMSMHAELYWLESSSEPSDHLSAETQSASLPSQRQTDRARAVRWWVSTAAGLLALLGWAFVSQHDWSSPATTTSQVADLDADAKSDRVDVARITGSLNCRWKHIPSSTPVGYGSSSTPVGYGSSLHEGQQLELLEGIAEITFENGARMILQSPSRLDVAADRSELYSGRLTATCPPGAEGFTVNTHGLKVIDRGTEFGVLADVDGNAEVHVFNGLVEGHYRESKDGPFKTVQWRTNEAVRYEGQNNKLSRLDQSDTTFVRTLSSNLGPVSGLLAGEDFDYPAGPLGGQNGGFGWGGPWVDVSVQSDLPDGSGVWPGSLRHGVLSSSGNHASLSGSYNRIRRLMSTSFNGVFDSAGFVEEQDGARVIGRDGTTLYFGFLQKIDALDQGFYGFELHRGDGNRNRVLCIGHGAAKRWTEGKVRAPDIEAGVTGWAATSEINGQNNSLLELGDFGPETTDVVLFVAKITFGENNVDTIEVFKNPPSLWDETKCVPDVVGQGNFAFDRIGLANFKGNKTFEVDHVQVGTSFAGVIRPSWRESESDGDETNRNQFD
jgi:hypothetical protein